MFRGGSSSAFAVILTVHALVMGPLSGCRGGAETAPAQAVAALPAGCQTYLERMSACADDIPAVARDALKSDVEQHRAAWSATAASPALAAECASALETAGRAYATMCRRVRWQIGGDVRIPPLPGDPSGGPRLTPTCKRLFERYPACIAALPEADRAAPSADLKVMTDFWAKTSHDDDAADELACRTAIDQLERGVARRCPGVSFE